MAGPQVSPEFLAQFQALTAPAGTAIAPGAALPSAQVPVADSGPSIPFLAKAVAKLDAADPMTAAIVAANAGRPAPTASTAPPTMGTGALGIDASWVGGPSGANVALPDVSTTAPGQSGGLFGGGPPAQGPGPAPSPQPAASSSAPAANAAPIGPPPPPPETPADVQFRKVSGGFPSREMDVRGPRQNAHLMASFTDPLVATESIAARSQDAAMNERAVYEEQARRAVERQAAAERVALQRQAELERLQYDVEDQVQKLGQMKLDQNRAWANKSTPEKIGTVLLAFLGGIAATDPKGTGRNIAYETIMREADEDIEVQKFDYMAQADRTKAAQSAFGVAMERFQSEDAATAIARAAAIDFSLAKLGQVQADWKGAEALNMADDLRARLLSERERTIAAGIKFIPASVGGRYQMVVRGQVIPGLVDEKRAQEIALKHGVEPAERVDEEMVKGGIGLTGKRMEIDAKRGERADEGAKFIASQLQSAGVPQARAAAERALAALNVSEGGKGEAAIRYGLGDTLSKAVLSEDRNAREQAYSDFMNAAMKATFGNVTASEEVRAARSYGSTGDPAARRRSIVAVINTLDQMEQSTKAGTTPDAQRRFDEQREAATGGKAAAPAGAKKGW